ncbi:MAG TPA: amidohydrolase family protein [Stellaceae bacterium]|nr:amidohydrolase family protein [Stellaceae bacterium]
MRIVDAQIHLWSKGTTLPPHRAEPYGKEQALADMDAAGVDGAVIHPPSWDADANELAVEAARAHPGRFAILGRLALDRPESRALVEGWKRRPGMLGFRFTFLQPQQKSWPTDGTMDWLWPAAERAGLPVALLADEFLPLLGEIAGRHPGLKLIVDHMGAVRNRKGAAAFEHMPQLVALARHPNIAVKATGGPSYAEDAYPFRSLHPYYRRLYDAFGPTRMFWGTDITRMPCSWRQCVTAFTEEMPFLSERDKALIMGQALCDWIGWT